MEHLLEKDTAAEAKENLNPEKPAKKKTHSMER